MENLRETGPKAELVRAQYERFPYPPVPWLALPRRGQGEVLCFDRTGRPHDGIRILVAGAGTLEALVVAQAHPRAREVVALDLSSASLKILARRVRAARVLRPLSRIAPVRTECADVLAWEPVAKFDYILASNVLHHLAEPTTALARLSSWLKPGGFLRLVTYPKQSRIFMRETSKFLRARGLSPESPSLVREARRAIRSLSVGDPRRSCFESQPETRARAGLVDAFFHACETPLSPLQWRDACEGAGLTLRFEAQTETSRSSFLDDVVPRAAVLSAWEKLQVLDDLLELCANPVLWLEKTGDGQTGIGQTVSVTGSGDWKQEMRNGVTQAMEILAPYATLDEVLEGLRRETGPRPLPGLSILDYSL